MVASRRDSPWIRALAISTCFNVGDGNSIDVWKDSWVPWLEGFTPTPRVPSSTTTPLLVSSLIDPINRCWKNELLVELFDTVSVSAINRIIIPLVPHNDKLIWTPDPSVINPPICPGHWVNPKTLKAQCSIQIALILECVWRIWNQIVHNDAKVNLLAEEKNLEDRIIEHLQVLQLAKSTVISAPHLWKAPPAHIVKLNTDAAIIDLGATIAVVARYSNGSLFQGWTKILLTSDPCIAEAVALLWALEIARAVHMPDIIVEEDAKLCCDAFNDGSAAIP
uniref:RNase H type-1 domain-containing protein n=1 Tax=Fagus sylvatica TaxID=28930 RepID=A0A2N9HDB4_FAGSY